MEGDKRATIKATVGLLTIAILAYAGYQGRQYARLSAELETLAEYQVAVQRQMLRDPKATDRRDKVSTTGRQEQDSKTSEFVDATFAKMVEQLKQKLGEIESTYQRSDSLVGNPNVLLAQATLALANADDAGALRRLEKLSLSAVDANSTSTASQVVSRGLRLRAYASSRLHRTEDAIRDYKQLTRLDPNDSVVVARLAENLKAAGRLEESFDAYERLAQLHERRGHTSLAAQDLPHALAEFNQTVMIRKFLHTKSTRPEQTVRLLNTYNHRARALVLAGKLDAATADLDRATRIGQSMEADNLDSERASVLGAAFNDRGVIRYVQGQIAGALRDFTQAVELRARVPHQPHQEIDQRSESAQNEPIESLQKTLDIGIGQSERNIHMQIRSMDARPWANAAVELATSHYNRGCARLAQRQLQAAIDDFEASRQIFSTVSTSATDETLNKSRAKVLARLATIYAASRLESIRNREKAIELAKKACELEDWQNVNSIVLLASACANAGEFSDAVKWQQKAITLVSQDDHKAQLRRRLNLYKSNAARALPLKD